MELSTALSDDNAVIELLSKSALAETRFDEVAIHTRDKVNTYSLGASRLTFTVVRAPSEAL